MDSLVLTRRQPAKGEPQKAFLTHRQFYGNSPDYSTIARLAPELAIALGEVGLVGWSQDLEGRCSGPAIIFSRDADDDLKVTASVRACGDDPSTEAVSFQLETSTARSIVEPGNCYRISWLYGAPSAADLGLSA